MIDKEYKYGFSTDNEPILKIKGKSKEIIKKISKEKDEPEWMLEFRLKAYDIFLEKELPKWGPDLSELDFDDFLYFVKNRNQVTNNWDEIPEEIKRTFKRLGISKDEQEWLAGLNTQFNSETVYSSTKDELKKLGVIFESTDVALKKYPELFKKYFNSVIKPDNNKFAALNGAFWSGGSFIYIPKGVKLDRPLQAYYRINERNLSQFERSLIIVEEDAYVHYTEACTAPIYNKLNMHAAVVELIVKDKGECKYTSLQNWSNNVWNFATKSALVYKNAKMDWVAGEFGAGVNMIYPSSILIGDNSSSTVLSIAVAVNQTQDTGAKMIHIGKNTSSSILAKSVVAKNSICNYRGLVVQKQSAINAHSIVECDTLFLNQDSASDTIQTNVVENNSSILEHESFVSKISEERLNYLMSKGLNELQAREVILHGYMLPIKKQIPLEFANEYDGFIKSIIYDRMCEI